MAYRDTSPPLSINLTGAILLDRSSIIQSRTPAAAALPSAPNKAVSTATATFAMVFQCRIIFSSFH